MGAMSPLLLAQFDTHSTRTHAMSGHNSGSYGASHRHWRCSSVVDRSGHAKLALCFLAGRGGSVATSTGIGDGAMPSRRSVTLALRLLAGRGDLTTGCGSSASRPRLLQPVLLPPTWQGAEVITPATTLMISVSLFVPHCEYPLPGRRLPNLCQKVETSVKHQKEIQ
jgi:hypothetical protein